jgi:hypothetical protein
MAPKAMVNLAAVEQELGNGRTRRWVGAGSQHRAPDAVPKRCSLGRLEEDHGKVLEACKRGSPRQPAHRRDWAPMAAYSLGLESS